MKKVLLIVAALFAGLQAHAQLAVDGGYLHAFEKWTYSSTAQRTDLDGFYAGAKYNISLDNWADGLMVSPGANISMLFGKSNSNIVNYTVKEIALNVPIHFIYNFVDVSDLRVFASAGPVLQVGLAHRYVLSSGDTYNLYNAANNSGVSRAPFNIYLGAGAGIEVAERFVVNVGYDFGLLNMCTTANVSVKRGLLKIGVGYIF